MSEKLQRDILQDIARVLREVKDDFNREVTLDSDIREMDLDSLDTINFLFSLEELFNVTLDFELVEKEGLAKISKLIDYIIDNTAS